MFKPKTWDNVEVPDRAFGHLKDSELEVVEVGYSRKAVFLNERIALHTVDEGVQRLQLADVMDALAEIEEEKKFRDKLMNGGGQ